MRLRIAFVAVFLVVGCTAQPQSYIESHKLAAKYQNQRDFERAEHYHRQAVEQMRGDPTTPESTLASGLSNLASALNHLNRPTEAKPLLQEAIQIQGRQAEPNIETTAAIYSNLARAEELDGNFDAAETMNLRALEIDRTIPDLWPPHLGAALAGLARVYAAECKFSVADDLHLKAKEQYAAGLGQTSAPWIDAEYQKSRGTALLNQCNTNNPSSTN